MTRCLLVLCLMWSYHNLYGQILNDSLQRIITSSQKQIDFYLKNAGLLSSLDLTSIGSRLESLHSAQIFNTNNFNYYKRVKSLNSSFKILKSRSRISPADTFQAFSIYNQMEKMFEKRESEMIELKMENQNLKKQNYYLKMDTIRWRNNFQKSRDNEVRAKNQTKSLERKIRQYEHGTYWGLSLGFNYFFNNQPNYYIKPDSTIGVLGSPSGLSFLVSAIVGYKFNEKHSFIFNVPLGDFTRNSQNAIGLFNQKLAGGLGYGYHIAGVALIAILNISPYEKLAPELLDGKKIEGEIYSRIDLSNYPTSTAYSPSITLGMSYNFKGKYIFNQPQPDESGD